MANQRVDVPYIVYIWRGKHLHYMHCRICTITCEHMDRMAFTLHAGSTWIELFHHQTNDQTGVSWREEKERPDKDWFKCRFPRIAVFV